MLPPRAAQRYGVHMDLSWVSGPHSAPHGAPTRRVLIDPAASRTRGSDVLSSVDNSGRSATMEGG
jgi:hypothetical protein